MLAVVKHAEGLHARDMVTATLYDDPFVGPLGTVGDCSYHQPCGSTIERRDRGGFEAEHGSSRQILPLSSRRQAVGGPSALLRRPPTSIKVGRFTRDGVSSGKKKEYMPWYA